MATGQGCCQGLLEAFDGALQHGRAGRAGEVGGGQILASRGFAVEVGATVRQGLARHLDHPPPGGLGFVVTPELVQHFAEALQGIAPQGRVGACGKPGRLAEQRFDLFERLAEAQRQPGLSNLHFGDQVGFGGAAGSGGSQLELKVSRRGVGALDQQVDQIEPGIKFAFWEPTLGINLGRRLQMPFRVAFAAQTFEPA